MSSFRILVVVSVLLLPCAEAVAACSPQGPISYVCGVNGAEDLVAIPDTPWIIASGLSRGSEPGALVLIDRTNKTSSVLFPSDSVAKDLDASAYPACPGPISARAFSAHGMSVRRGAEGVHTLYVVNHGEREAVEVFELNVAGRAPKLTWKGCVLTPSSTRANAVTPLEQSTIAVTFTTAPEYFATPEDATRLEAWIPKFSTGQPTGHVAKWSSNRGWEKVHGTEGSVPNGIEASTDERWLWVANWGSREIVRVPLRAGDSRAVVKVDLMPDNVRWGDDGNLWVAGATGTVANYFACWSRPGCKNDYAIVKIDPSSLTPISVPHPNTLPEFGEATTALKIGSDVWIGAFPGDRVAYMRLTP